jgi:hypothetical protein
MMPTLYEELLEAAINVWKPTSARKAVDGINRYWRDCKVAKDNRHIVLHIARQCILSKDRLLHSMLVKKHNEMEGYEKYWKDKPLEKNFSLSLAFLKTALAVTTAEMNNFSSESEKDVACLLGDAMVRFDTCWLISVERVDIPKSNHWKSDKPQHEKILSLLGAGPSKPLLSTYLVMEHIVWSILHGSRPSDHKTEFLMPFAGIDKFDPQHKVGECLSFLIRKTASSQFGCYPDPYTIGAITFDKKFERALTLAWRFAKQDHNTTKKALRIELPFNELPYRLDGPSGGALLSVALRLTLEGRNFASYKSATGSLEVPKSGTGSLNDPDSEIRWEEVQIGEIGATLPKLKNMFLTTYVQGVGLAGKNYSEWKAADERPPAQEVKSLSDLYKFLTADNPSDNLLEKYRLARFQYWETLQKDQQKQPSGKVSTSGAMFGRDDFHQVYNYVPQRLRIESNLMQTQEISRKGHTDEDYVLKKLLEISFNGQDTMEVNSIDHPVERCFGKEIVIYDRAGSGKSVATLRIAHLLSSKQDQVQIVGHSSPLLVVRIEGRWTSGSDLLCSLQQMLVENVISFLGHPERGEVEAMVNHAIVWQRAVVIVDGFDQFSDHEQSHILGQMHSYDGRRCRWIVASREHTIDQLFSDDLSNRWMRVRLEPFDYEEQNEFFKKAGLTDWYNKIEASASNQLLGSPLILRRLADILLSTSRLSDSGSRMSQLAIESDSQLGVVAMRRSLHDGLQKHQKQSSELSRYHSAIHVDLLDRVLSTIAFQIMIEKNKDASISREQVEEFLERCCLRFLMKTNRQIVEKSMLLERGVGQSRELLEGELFLLKKRRERQYSEWLEAIDLLYRIELSHRDWVERASNQGFAFQSRKAMELYAARYLTRFATREDVFGLEGDPAYADWPCAFDFISDENWFETWRLAIEMPRRPLTREYIDGNSIADETTMCMSLSALFQLPKHGLRPTELIYRCWHLFEWDPEVFCERRVRLDNKWIPASMFRNDPAFESTGRSLLLGAISPSVQDEVKKVMTSFRTTVDLTSGHHLAPDDLKPVTLAMYRKFDPAFEKYPLTIRSENLKKRKIQIGQLLPNDQSAVVGVTWYDAFVFCKWMGSHMRLPWVCDYKESSNHGKTNRARHGEWCAANIDQPGDQDLRPIVFFDNSKAINPSERMVFRGLRDECIGFRV